MRVLWLSHFYPYPPAGGALQRSYHLLRQTALNHEVHLIALTKTRNRPALEAAGEGYPEPVEFCSSVERFPIPAERTRFHRTWTIASTFWDPRPYDVRWLECGELSEHLDRRVSADSVDVLHLDTLGLCQYGESIRQVPAVMNHHNVESHMMDRRAADTGNVLERWYLEKEAERLRRWERLRCPGYRCNLVCSDLDGDRLEDTAPGTEWAVVPNGVDVDYFAPDADIEPEATNLVFVGRMSWYPNRDAIEWFLREIWPRLVDTSRDYTLDLVGSSPPASLIEKASASDRIDAPGFVPDVRPYMNRAGIYVCPIRTGGGTRLKILDAMAMGMPIVATSMSVEGLDLQDGEHFLQADTPSEFSEAVDRLRGDPEARRSLADAARDRAVERYSWKRIGSTLSDIYRTAATG